MDYIGVSSLVFGAASLIIAWFQYNDKKKLEQFSKTTLRGMAGNIAKIQQSSSWAWHNIKNANKAALELPDSNLKIPLLRFLSTGMSDTAATDRLITNLFNDVLNMQEAQFETRIITHPEKKYLDLYTSEQAQSIESNK